MDSSSPAIKLHFETLPHNTKQAFDALKGALWLAEESWYLAGGTALALQVGHRTSLDLDFFTQNKEVDTNTLLTHFIDNPDWITELNKKNTIFGSLHGAKVSFIAYPFFIPKQPTFDVGAIKILSPIDIAVMKVTAISQRGRKRDFYDLYWLSHHIETLEQIVRRLGDQYPTVAHEYHHILKSLVYFADAEEDVVPEITYTVSWQEVKNFFIQEVPIVAKRVIHLL